MSDSSSVECPGCGERFELAAGPCSRLVACPNCDSLLEVRSGTFPEVRLAEDPLGEDEPDPDENDSGLADASLDGPEVGPRAFEPDGEFGGPADDLLDEDDAGDDDETYDEED